MIIMAPMPFMTFPDKKMEARSLFREMLQLCREYTPAINSHTSPFSTEGLFMAVLFMQFKMLRWLKSEVQRLRLKHTSP